MNHLIAIGIFSLVVIVIGIASFAISKSRCSGQPSNCGECGLIGFCRKQGTRKQEQN